MISPRDTMILAAAAALVGSPALAAPAAPERAAIVQALSDCRKLTDDSARLACYDKAAAAFDQAETKGDIVVVDRDQARKVRRQAFGFSLPSISLFEKGETQEELENVTGKLASAGRLATGQWRFKLEDGAVWDQVDHNELFKTPKPGMAVRVRKASLGSFLMIIENQRAVRVKRVE